MSAGFNTEVALVTAALHDRLDACVKRVVDGAKVVVGRPDAKRQEPEPGLNLFLYEVLTNPFMSNMGDQARKQQSPDAQGLSVDVPLAALDLHYLLTFNGKEEDLEPLLLLGSVIGNLANEPELGHVEMQASIDVRSSEGKTRSVLDGASPPYPGEPVILTPLNLNLEEMSRLWSVLLHEPFSLSLQYTATVVILRRDAKDPEPRVTTVGIQPGSMARSK